MKIFDFLYKVLIFFLLSAILLGGIYLVILMNAEISRLELKESELKEEITLLKNTLAEVENQKREISDLIYLSAKKYEIDPILYTILIHSESNFRPYPDHGLEYVIGMTAINTKYHKPECDIKTVNCNIETGAQVLSTYLKKYDGDMLKALTAYKGISEVGMKRAKQVIAMYNKVKK
jgi:soluble lytic murein transglycosylase-like protein